MKYWNTCNLIQKIERWENVLRVLQNLSPHERRKHWDMGKWGHETECGTVACAAGHCGMDHGFIRRGFKLNLDKSKLPFEYPYVENFFGYCGSDRIFCNDRDRPVSQVIKEVKSYLKYLKKNGDDEHEFE